VIVLNWNRKYDTLECLQSLQHVTYPNYKIIVVDNGSTDGSQELIKQRFHNIVLIENRRNLGFAEGNNVGIRYALRKGADYILLLNNDTIVDKNLLTELVRIAESDYRIGICGPKIYFYNAPNKIWFAGGMVIGGITYHVGAGQVDIGQYETIRPVDYITGCAMMIKGEVIKRIGLLDPDYFCIFEDADLCLRSRRAGFEVVYIPTAKVWHKISSSFGGYFSPLSVYYRFRNNILFMRKNMHASDWLPFSIYFARILLTSIMTAILHKKPEIIYQIFRGLVAGACNVRP